VVEEGRAWFDGSRHRHAICFDEQIAREVGVQVGVERLVEERAFGRVKSLGQQGLGVIRLERKLALP
jgi:hypothetical protein